MRRKEYSFHLIEAEVEADYSAISTRHNAPQAGAGPLGRTGTCSFLRRYGPLNTSSTGFHRCMGYISSVIIDGGGELCFTGPWFFSLSRLSRVCSDLRASPWPPPV